MKVIKNSEDFITVLIQRYLIGAANLFELLIDISKKNNPGQHFLTNNYDWKIIMYMNSRLKLQNGIIIRI